RLVAVVMGGASGRSRDNQMASLINTYLPRASTRGGGNLIAKAGGDNPVKALAKVLLPKHDAPTPDEKPAAEDTEVASADDSTPLAQETKPVIQVRKVKTVAVAAMGPPPAPASQTETASQAVAAYAEPAPAAAPSVDPVKTSSVPSGWVVQVASSPTQSGAQALLDKTSKQAPKVLA